MKANPLLLISLYFFCFPTLAGLNSLLSSMSGGGMSKLRRQICTWSAPCFFTVSWESGTGGTEKTIKFDPFWFSYRSCVLPLNKVDEWMDIIWLLDIKATFPGADNVFFVSKTLTTITFRALMWMSKSVLRKVAPMMMDIQFWLGMQQFQLFQRLDKCLIYRLHHKPAPGFRWAMTPWLMHCVGKNSEG